MARQSAAYIVAILAVMMFIVGALVLTTLDPVMQAVFGSPGWSSSTEQGTDLLTWQKAAWSFVATAILLSILMEIWIGTRQST